MTQQTSQLSSSLPVACGTIHEMPRYRTIVLGLCLAACGGERLSVGSDEAGSSAAPGLCGDGVVTHDVTAQRQEEIDALRDCESIEGKLHIARLPGNHEAMSLAALSSLRRVSESLEIEALPSLSGLEGLEQVGNLKIVALESADLSALSNLQRVVWDSPRGGKGGVITISQCENLQSLAGLELLTTWKALALTSNPVLESLSGLAGPATSFDLTLHDLPKLRDLRGLEFAREVGNVSVEQTGVESLAGFPIISAETLKLAGNAALRRLDGLRRLVSLQALRVQDNDSLVSVQLPNLDEAQLISIKGNAVLPSVPAYRLTGGRRASFGSIDWAVPSIGITCDLYEVGDNPSLTHISAPIQYGEIRQLSIWRNPALLELDLQDLMRAGGLQIRDNLSLRSVNFSGPLQVGELEILNNPALTTSGFADLQTFSSTMSGNLDTPAP